MGSLMNNQQHRKKRIINWIDEIIDVAAIQMGVTTEIILARGIEIQFPGDVFSVVKQTGEISNDDMLIVTGGAVKITSNNAIKTNVRIKIGKYLHEFN